MVDKVCSSSGDLKSAPDVRKVRLKTSSGVLTLCYRKPSMQANGGEGVGSSIPTDTHTSGHSVSDEPGFENLENLFEMQKDMIISDDQFSLCSRFQPDFSAYHFWTQNVPDNSTIYNCTRDTISDSEPIHSLVSEPQFPDTCSLDYPATPLPHPQSRFHQESTSPAAMFSGWKSPSVLEEDNFEALIDTFTPSIRISSEENVGNSDHTTSLPQVYPELDIGNTENKDLLLYSPPGYIEEAIFLDMSKSSEQDVGTYLSPNHSPSTTITPAHHQMGRKRPRFPRNVFSEDVVGILSPKSASSSSQWSDWLSDADCRIDESPKRLDQFSDAHGSGKREGFAGKSDKLSSCPHQSHCNVSDLTDLNCGIMTGETNAVGTGVLVNSVSDSSRSRGYVAKSLHDPSTVIWEQQLKSEYASMHDFVKTHGRQIRTSRDEVISRSSQSYRRKRSYIHSTRSPRFKPLLQVQSTSSSHHVEDENKVNKGREMSSHNEKPKAKGIQGRRSSKAKRLPLPQQAVETLQDWMNEHESMPYPSKDEKQDLVLQTGLRLTQVENWLANARQKLKTSDINIDDSLTEEQWLKSFMRKRAYRLHRL